MRRQITGLSPPIDVPPTKYQMACSWFGCNESSFVGRPQSPTTRLL